MDCPENKSTAISSNAVDIVIGIMAESRSCELLSLLVALAKDTTDLKGKILTKLNLFGKMISTNKELAEFTVHCIEVFIKEISSDLISIQEAMLGNLPEPVFSFGAHTGMRVFTDSFLNDNNRIPQEILLKGIFYLQGMQYTWFFSTHACRERM